MDLVCLACLLCDVMEWTGMVSRAELGGGRFVAVMIYPSTSTAGQIHCPAGTKPARPPVRPTSMPHLDTHIFHAWNVLGMPNSSPRSNVQHSASLAPPPVEPKIDPSDKETVVGARSLFFCPTFDVRMLDREGVGPQVLVDG